MARLRKECDARAIGAFVPQGFDLLFQEAISSFN
jgi:hypothetical protein